MSNSVRLKAECMFVINSDRCLPYFPQSFLPLLIICILRWSLKTLSLSYVDWTCPVKAPHCVKAEDLSLYNISLRSRRHRNHCYFMSWHNTGTGVHRTQTFVVICILFLSLQCHQTACIGEQKGQTQPLYGGVRSNRCSCVKKGI